MLSAILASAVIAPAAMTQTYTVTNVDRHAVFAGKLGYRISETLTLKSQDGTVTVKVLGDAHTLTLRKRSMLAAGATIMIKNDSLSDGKVRREAIMKVR